MDSIPSLINAEPFRSVFLVLGLPQVLELGHWPNIWTNFDCLAFYPHNRPSRSFFSYSMGGKEHLDVIVAPSRPFFLPLLNVRHLLNYPSRAFDVSIYKVRFH